MPDTPIKNMCKVTSLFLFGIPELRVLSLLIVPACWAVAAFRVGKGLASGQKLKSLRQMTLS
eukprot:1136161-Pelagomonas_calceolata.AAC.3